MKTTMRASALAVLCGIILSAPAFGDMQKDSPVFFPKEGALPAKYLPDQGAKDGTAPEEGYYLFSTPERSLEQIAKIQQEMPAGEFTAPPADWTHLPRTRQILTSGGELRLMAIGDSIVNDTMRSAWVAKLAEAYPQARISASVYVRGGGGCQHYKENGRIAKVVVPKNPNLVLLGGISQQDIASIREVIQQLRAALPEAEILLATGTFGTADPRVPEELAAARHSGTGEYGKELQSLAATENCAYLDMTTPWAEYIRTSKVHPHVFYRDVVHANEFGEQILGKILLAFFTAASPSTDDPDLVVADFEADNYGDWAVTGTAFGPGPAQGTLPNQMPVSGFQGKRLVNSYFEGDGTTGTLTSPPFTIERRYLNFLLGGGKAPREACINLLVDGQVVRTETGPNDRAGGSERLDWYAWDVQDLQGKQAVIQIVDQRQGGWGHINVDQIVQSNTRKEMLPAARKINISARYLHFPVQRGAMPVRMKVTVGERIVDEFDIELATDKVDYWTFLDMGEYQGKQATVEVPRLLSDSKALAQIQQAADVPGAKTLYQEKFRPQFHFSPRVGWNNDPNGLVYSQGEWHLYFQHNPYGWGWGNMHWGHAVSKDLVHWTELPIAIYPFKYDDWVFSGGAVVDAANTSGFKTGDNELIVASYTSTGRGEAIAYSNDRGRTFTDYPGNPVVKHQGRDPKIIWFAPGKHWVMAVYDEEPVQDGVRQSIAFYTSTDLKEWTLQSKIPGYFECPEIFELAVDGDKKNTRWVIYAADGAYQVGSFDGKTFQPEHKDKIRYNWGNCFYASQTYSNVPAEDGRRIQVAWGQIGSDQMPFNQQMNFPVELTLRSTAEGLRVFANPIKEIALLHGKPVTVKQVALNAESNSLEGKGSELMHIQCVLEPGTAKQLVLNVRGVPITYDVAAQQLSCLDKQAPLPLVDGRVTVELLVDRMSIEIFGNGGSVYMPMGKVLDVENTSLGIQAVEGAGKLVSATVYPLQSAWKSIRP